MAIKGLELVWNGMAENESCGQSLDGVPTIAPRWAQYGRQNI